MKAVLIDLDGTKRTIEVPENAPNTWLIPINGKAAVIKKDMWKDNTRKYKLQWIYPSSSLEKKWALYKEVEQKVDISGYSQSEIVTSVNIYSGELLIKANVPIEPPPQPPPKLPPVEEKKRRRMKLKC